MLVTPASCLVRDYIWLSIAIKVQWQGTTGWKFCYKFVSNTVLAVKKISSVNEQRCCVLVVSSGFLKYMATFQPNKLDFVLSFPQTLFRYLHIFSLEQLSDLNQSFQFFTGLVLGLSKNRMWEVITYPSLKLHSKYFFSHIECQSRVTWLIHLWLCKTS